MRTLSGSGPTGMAGMLSLVELTWLRLVRPLLAFPPARLRATLAAAGVEWIEDPSNRRCRRPAAALALAAPRPGRHRSGDRCPACGCHGGGAAPRRHARQQPRPSWPRTSWCDLRDLPSSLVGRVPTDVLAALLQALVRRSLPAVLAVGDRPRRGTKASDVGGSAAVAGGTTRAGVAGGSRGGRHGVRRFRRGQMRSGTGGSAFGERLGAAGGYARRLGRRRRAASGDFRRCLRPVPADSARHPSAVLHVPLCPTSISLMPDV